MVTYVSSWSMPCPMQMTPYQQQVALPTTEARDNKVEELNTTKEKLYLAREKAVDLQERLTLALRSNDDLDDQLECFKLGYDDARMREERTVRELVALQKDASCKRTGQVKAVFARANMGAKIERLSADKTASIIVLADAVVAQHRKMSRLLTALKKRYDALQKSYDLKVLEQQASEAKLAEDIAELKSAVVTTQSELSRRREETALCREHVQKLEEHIALHQKSHAEAENKVTTSEKKIATLVRKQARSKGISAKLYEENKQLQEGRSFGRCSVCFEEGLQLLAFIPCGHAAVCLSCGAKVSKCPICMAHVKARAPLYFCM